MARYGLLRPWAAEPRRDLGHLRREMDALFNRFGGESVDSSGWRGVFPAVNFYEAEDAYILTAELPGVEADSIDVALEGTTVTLRGERKIQHPEGERAGLHRAERQSGSFRRAFELPEAIDAGKVEAVYQHGVLMLRFPKTPEAQPRRIAVSAS